MTSPALTRVHRRRAATQRVTSAGLEHAGEVVRLLLAVQAQDAPMAAWSLGLRMPEGATYAEVLRQQRLGGWVRTHALRPTWHLLAPEDLRWVQRLTGPRIESSLGARHRQLGLDDRARERAVETLRELLAGGVTRTRPELTRGFAARGLPASGEQMGHQLLVAELRAVICSGPPRGSEHTYVLVDEAVPPGPRDHLQGDAARTELVRRFMAGHGPATDRDLARWSTLTLTEIRAALAALGDVLDHLDVGGARMWFDPDVPARTTRHPGALLVPTFDELTLTYADHGPPRRDPASPRPRLVNAIGGGTVLHRGEDVAAWSRRVARNRVEVRIVPDRPLGRAETEAVTAGAERLAAFLELPLELRIAPAS